MNNFFVVLCELLQVTKTHTIGIIHVQMDKSNA